MKALKERYFGLTQQYFRPKNWWKRTSSEKLWIELVGQICIIGRSVPWDSLKASPDINRISIVSLSQVYEKEGRGGLVRHIHTILAKHGVRYVSKNKAKSRKAEQITDAFLNPTVVKNQELILLSKLEGTPDPRHALRTAVKGVGLKSASDYLIETGFSDDYMALDVRVMTILKKWQKNGLFQDLTISPKSYIQIEARLRKAASRAGLTLGELDRIIYRNYSNLKES